ncbi:MAG: hypothetical protein ACRD1T_02920 [Acidimicrobiia bacterium]
MPTDSFTAWLLTQALGPELVSRALDALGNKSWRRRLAKSIAHQHGARVSERRLRRWLDRQETWDLLVAFTPQAVEALRESLASDLRPRVVVRKARYDADRLSDLASALVPIAIGEFLTTLDPSRAVAVAHYREMNTLVSIEHNVTQILETMDLDRDFPSLLRRVPPTASPLLQELLGESRSVCSTLLKGTLGGQATPAEAVYELINAPPQWLDAAPATAWLVLAEMASGYGRHIASAKAFETAAQRGAADRGILMARAALEASTGDDDPLARRFIEQAKEISADRYPFVTIAALAFDERKERLLESADSYPVDAPYRNIVLGMKGNVLFSERDWNAAIAAYEAQLAEHARMSGAVLRIAQCLLARATEGLSPSR